MVWVSRVSRERDRPLEATSSEEVKAAFVSLLSAACLVIIPLYMSTDQDFQERSQPNWPTEECTTHRQQRLTSRSATEMPDWGRHSKYMKPSLVRRACDEQICRVRLLQCSDIDTCRADRPVNLSQSLSSSSFLHLSSGGRNIQVLYLS